jgi:hypothetical protein
MADISKLRAFARNNNFGITGPLTHNEVHALAVEWMPEMRFHEDENFHCISYGDLLGLRDRDVRREDYLNTVSASNPAISLSSKPPVFFESEAHKLKVDPSAAGVRSASYVSNLVEVGDAVSNFDTRDRSPWGLAAQYFGSNSETNGVKLPRMLPVTAIAEYRDLRQFLALRIRAEMAAANGTLPTDPEPDSRGVLLDAVLGPPLFELSDDASRKSLQLTQLQQLVESADRADQGDSQAKSREATILRSLVTGGVITSGQWRVMRDFALLEYFFVYSYNDISKHHLFLTGDHEGDVEGFGVVFNRHRVAGIAREADRIAFLRNQLRPTFLISSSHEPFQGLDSTRNLEDPQLSLADIKATLRVWIMAGSHATYLAPGEYQNLDIVDEPIMIGSAAATALAVPAYAVPLALIVLLIEHLLNPEEETSDAGVHTIPPRLAEQPGTDPTLISSRVLTTPLSQDRNIYQDAWKPGRATEIDVTLAERVFPGRWGFAGPRAISKAARFTRKLAERYFDD